MGIQDGKRPGCRLPGKYPPAEEHEEIFAGRRENREWLRSVDKELIPGGEYRIGNSLSAFGSRIRHSG